MSTDTPNSLPGQIMLKPMCHTHRALLMAQVGYSENDPWLALEVMTSVALFQAATADPRVQAEAGHDVAKIPHLGCLACRKPDAFGEIVEAAKTRRPGAIKELGEQWVRAGARP